MKQISEVEANKRLNAGEKVYWNSDPQSFFFLSGDKLHYQESEKDDIDTNHVDNMWHWTNNTLGFYTMEQ